jgi:hypothetical protein
MNKVEQLHLDAIENNIYSESNYSKILGRQETASKSAEITEQIAIEFQQWVEDDCFKVIGTTKYRIGTLDKSSIEYSIGELFQEFLKTKQL